MAIVIDSHSDKLLNSKPLIAVAIQSSRK